MRLEQAHRDEEPGLLTTNQPNALIELDFYAEIVAEMRNEFSVDCTIEGLPRILAITADNRIDAKPFECPLRDTCLPSLYSGDYDVNDQAINDV